MTDRSGQRTKRARVMTGWALVLGAGVVAPETADAAPGNRAASSSSAPTAPTASQRTARATTTVAPRRGPRPLPTPPESDDPKAYAAWLAALPKVERDRVMRICRANPTEPEPVCGGIGPLHIPAPPTVDESADPAHTHTAFAQWKASLSPAQRRYVWQQCVQPRYSIDALCRGGPALVLDLPIPPEDDDPTIYAAWLAALSKAERDRVMELCRANPTEPEPLCGGIGPLHIPVPPLVAVPLPRGAARAAPTRPLMTFEQWKASLTPAQRRYVELHCPPNTDGGDTLCGATPLVLAFADQPVEFRAGGSFALVPGQPTAIDWPTATTPWLALDRDGDGAITSGAELFGDSTVLPSGATAAGGFAALAALDGNHDGVLDAADPGFARLLLWSDHDGDRRSQPDELRPLASIVESISLDYQMSVRCDDRLNCEGERSTMWWRDRTGTRHRGAVVDVYLPRR